MSPKIIWYIKQTNFIGIRLCLFIRILAGISGKFNSHISWGSDEISQKPILRSRKYDPLYNNHDSIAHKT